MIWCTIPIKSRQAHTHWNGNSNNNYSTTTTTTKARQFLLSSIVVFVIATFGRAADFWCLIFIRCGRLSFTGIPSPSGVPGTGSIAASSTTRTCTRTCTRHGCFAGGLGTAASSKGSHGGCVALLYRVVGAYDRNGKPLQNCAKQIIPGSTRGIRATSGSASRWRRQDFFASYRYDGS